MEKAFYPRNDTVNAVVSNLLPRDGKEDILPDQNGDPVYLQRSSILDGTEIRGFGYCEGHPYKWKVEVESAMKSLVVVPDRFFSIYGKSYPIKRMQTVGINQPSEAFKYEIIYLRGYDKYDDEKITARVIYNRQYEEDLKPYVCSTDEEALDILNQFEEYPYLKLRVCMDGSIRAYLGKKEVGWDYTRQISEDTNAAEANRYWVEIPQINTEQFRGIDLWVKFDSLNALSYYIITKYENNIFNISPKTISGGLQNVERPSVKRTIENNEIIYTVEAGKYNIRVGNTDIAFVAGVPGPNAFLQDVVATDASGNVMDPWRKDYCECSVTLDNSYSVKADSANEALIKCFLADAGYGTISNREWSYTPAVPNLEASKIQVFSRIDEPMTSEEKEEGATVPTGKRAVYGIEIGSAGFWEKGDVILTTERWMLVISEPFDNGLGASLPTLSEDFAQDLLDKVASQTASMSVGLEVDDVVGKDYDLNTPADLDESDPCTPCCKKSNLSRSIWAYVNPRTMTPYDDDYWFHQGEPYYKKSLTLSTKNNPLKAQRIFVEQGVFPGMYKIVGETYIRNRDTGKDERVQLTFPLCKIKSDQTLTLQADGDPTTFNLDVEVAVPQNGIPMEITFYEVEKEMKAGCGNGMVEKDGSTRISAG